MKAVTPSSATRSQHGLRLSRRIAFLVFLCTLPFAGLAGYFLATGLNHEIAVAQREQAGARHLRDTLAILQRAIVLVWREDGSDAGTILTLEQEFAALHQVESDLGTALSAGSLAPQAGSAATSAQVQAAWQAVLEAPADSAARKTALQELVRHLHEGIFLTDGRIGLGTGPESELNSLTHIAAFALPTHVERLLHLHERMAPDLRAGAWDDSTREAAAIFARQLQQQDLTRFRLGTTTALRADARSDHALDSFQARYPAQVVAFLGQLERVAATLESAAADRVPLDAVAFDVHVRESFEAALAFWGQSLTHLEHLLDATVATERRQRNQALLVTMVLASLLLPTAWGYFHRFIRPVLHEIGDESAKTQLLAQAARDAADDSLRRLRQTQAALDDHCAVSIFDTQGNILVVNDRMVSLSGYDRGELIGRPVPFIEAAAHDPDYLATLWTAVGAAQVWQGNLACRSKRGNLFWLSLTISPFFDRDGRAGEFIAIQTDITELVRAREGAENAAQAKSQFLAMMSHEIRTPMNGVLGFAHLLGDTRLDDQQRDYVRTILTSGESLLTIIDDVLDFSKLEAGRAELESRPVALRLLIEDVIDLLATAARTKLLELVYRIEPGVPEGFMGDETRLRQVLLNLAGNAVKFTTAGHVEIAVEHAPALPDGTRAIAIHVRDTGMGIPPDRLDRLFMAFSQVDASVTRTHGGTGLGLAISQRLVGLMGGEIRVSSTVGHGSDFYFALSVREADVTAQVRTRSPVATPEIEAGLRDRRILVVDDLAANQRLFERVLTGYGAVVTVVGSPGDAFARLREKDFDLAVIDYMMPGIDGITLAKNIRLHRTLPLVLATSAPPPAGEIPAGLFATILLKPIRNVQLAAAAAQVFVVGKSLPGAPRIVTESSPNFAAANPLRILAVDDNPVNLKVLAATLTSFGYAPELFRDAALALARLREQKFDLVLMDVQMPDLDGHEATRRLRAGGAGELNRQVRVVALTAGVMREEREACQAAGMDDFVAKPVPRAVLLAKLVEASAARSPPSTTSIG